MSEPDPIFTLFDTLDRWRHFPAYQLERRADIFFAIYIREVVASFTETELAEVIIPELPIKRDLIWPDRPTNKSVKLDYCLFAKDGSKVYFVELKTDLGSRRPEQDEYLSRSVEVGFRAIVDGIRQIVLATTARQKYHHLVSALVAQGHLDVPADLDDFVFPSPRSGLKQKLAEINVAESDPPIEVIYIQPTASGEDRCIDFETFASYVERHDDPLSRAFAHHLRRWTTAAGSERPR